MDSRINSYITDPERNAVLELRHAMHREPELSNNEWKTQQRIREMLERFGVEGANVFHGTGLYIDIQGSASGPKRAIAVRGDIDALPINETRDDLPFSSQVNGVMHACGHDLHASIAMGVALAFHRMRSNFAGKVRVFFQPAEEAEPLGGRTVAEEKLLEGFDSAVGYHVSPSIPLGKFGAREGAVSMSADQFTVTVTGSSAHGSTPHRGVDAITIAAAFVNEVQKVISREMPLEDRSVITIGTIHGGGATNIICPEVVMEGTIRTTSPERRGQLSQRLRDIAEGVAAIHRGKAEVSIQSGEPAVINDPGMVQLFQDAVLNTVGPDALTQDKDLGGSDDFGFYSQCVPSIYFWFGSGEPGKESGVHTPTFAVSDEVLIPTTELVIKYCFDLLGAQPAP
ncbi:peptidase M20 family protein (plasmid) [Rhizobium gallicum]|uniref:Peptidase M20 family protein n=1 Tax=Rhizobium gallicum TaxID=56730 RepID=A0A1L5NR71_9HYPH|nr:M20 family metallopeptidase [Rhizobium gallicum]APO70403.1 peptidase M20 family protein [Rhizobium gallicum]